MNRLALPLALLLLLGCAPRSFERPNVVVFMVDTLRADALGCYGATRPKTPHIDAFAAEGARFTSAIAQSSWTRASIASVFTGQYPWSHGALGRHDRLSTTEPTLAEQLQRGGYRTAAIVTNPNLDPGFGFGAGFEQYTTLYRWEEKRFIESHDLIAQAPEVVDASLAWIDEVWHDDVDGKAPFFLFVLVVDPHSPYTPPPPWDRHYDPTYEGSYRGTTEETTLAAVRRMSPRDRLHMRARYDGLVSYVDIHFGRFLDALRERDLDESTVVVFTADHGEEFFERGSWGHGTTLYDEQIRVPLIVRHPDARDHRDVDAVVETRDLFPTILAWAGVPDLTQGDAVDLDPCLRGPCSPREIAFSTLQLDGRTADVALGERFKLHHTWRPASVQRDGGATPERRQWHLHDRDADPTESDDFSANAPDVVRTYRRRLDEAKAAARARAAATEPPEARREALDAATQRALEALGYAE